MRPPASSRKKRFFPSHVRIKRDDAVHEIREFAEKLDPDEAAPDHHDCQQHALSLGIALRVGPLELLDEVVSKRERVC
jgi:hypothetical protein